MAHISVVVPVFKAEKTLVELYDRLCACVGEISSDFEIVLAEDGGQDRSWEIIQGLAAKDPRVKGLRFSRNFGQHYAITAGLDLCNADWTVVMDCDLQDRPEDIHKLYAKAREGYDVVNARRIHRKHSLLSRIASQAFYKLFEYLTDYPYDSQVANFRLLSRKAVCQIRQMREQLRFFGAMIHWMGFPTAAVEVEHGARKDGASTYTWNKRFALASDTIVAYSDKPLRLCVRFGLFMALASFGFGMILLIGALLYQTPVMGWPSLIVSLYFLSGIIIMILGINGIYLGKTFNESKKRPLYVVSDKTFGDAPL